MEVDARGQGMPAAAMLLGDASDIHPSLAAQGTAKPSVGQLDKQGGGLNRPDALAFIDKVFGVRAGSAGFVKIPAEPGRLGNPRQGGLCPR